MSDVSQVESKFSVEPRAASVNPTPSVSPARSPEPARGGRDETAVNVEISNEAQQLAANGDSAPEAPTPADDRPPADSGNSPETAFRASSGDGGTRTNQVTGFASERTGNGTRNASEANRTLGQVVDTFA
jgi:hypothetical protein